MSGALAALQAHTWAGMAAALGGFGLLFVLLQLLSRHPSVSAEVTRKLFHTGSGVMTVAFPFLFREAWPVLLLTGASAAVVAAVKFVPALGARFGGVANRVERTTLGEIYFPVSVAFLFWLTRAADPLLFVIPVLMLTFADATCALVGARYGQTRYVGTNKSLEGSVAFAVVAFFCVHVPLLVWSSAGRLETLLIATTLALLVMLLEGSAWRGLDNLFIPIGGYFLLHAYLSMDAATLASRLAVTLMLVGLVVIARRRMTLEDDSLVLGAFLCYVVWALNGWPWLIGPMTVALGYRFMSRRTVDNSRRMHGPPAVLSVWVPALVWLALARRGHDDMLLPYTVVFATHLSAFGTSRLAYQFARRPVAALALRATVLAWTIVMLPSAALAARSGAGLAAIALSIVPIAAGAGLFAATVHVRDAPQTPSRWVRQAGAATLASVAAWTIGLQIARVLP